MVRHPDGGEHPPSKPDGIPPNNGRATEPAQRKAAAPTLEGGWQSLVDADQTSSDTDQTLSDSDQTSSDSDQSSADRDQAASDCDQVASDHDLAAGVNREAYEFSRGVRKRGTLRREHNADDRWRIAEQRDDVAHLRDLAALARDKAAVARDLAMAQLDAAAEQNASARSASGIELVARAAEDRRRAAEHRVQAADYRLLAARDRDAAASDREQAAREREAAQADREALILELQRAAVDVLTGARTRAAGLRELEHELDRARRTSSPLTVAYIDVVGLKSVNDSLGHAAGDELLKRVVAHLRMHLRPYDLIIRLGGDEFLCVLPNLTESNTRERFASVTSSFTVDSRGEGFRTGFAQLRDYETYPELVERADRELIRPPR